jgi:hypothetical protein
LYISYFLAQPTSKKDVKQLGTVPYFFALYFFADLLYVYSLYLPDLLLQEQAGWLSGGCGFGHKVSTDDEAF